MRSATTIGAALVLALASVATATLTPAPALASARSTPPGWKVVRHAGVTVEVPASWPVVDLEADPTRCRRHDVHAAYLGEQGPEATCPAGLVGRVTTVQILRTDAGRRTVQVHSVAPGPIETAIAASVHVGPAPRSQTRRTAPIPAPTPPDGDGVAAAIPSARSAATEREGFDACTAPSSAQMAAWAKSSPYSVVGVYVGGLNRSCDQPNLTSSWVRTQLAAGWGLIPTYVGRQAPCTRYRLATISSSQAGLQGVSAARDAVAVSKPIGIGPGSPIYLDMEDFDIENAACTNAVITFISGWTTELHRLGYLSGVYSSAASGIDAMGRRYSSTSFARPDAVWIARWNKVHSDAEQLLTATQWADHRIHQYQGSHDETYGGVRINIDSNFVNGDVVRTAAVPVAAHAPFVSWDGFVAQQASDFAGSSGTLASRSATVRQLSSGAVTPVAHIQGLMQGSWFAPHVAPVARLYWAYFGRTPDAGGLRYWAGRHRGGTSLASISQSLATSSEFRTKTGTLSDRAFVARIYTEVLGRPADPDGLAYWTKRLTSRTASRGQVMVSFSESSEHIRRRAADVGTVLVYAGMLQRSPSATELAADRLLPTPELIEQVRASAAYANRVR